MDSRRSFFLVSLIFIVFSSTFAWSLTLKPTTLQQRLAWSERVCEVTVTEKRFEKDDYESQGRLVVYYTFEVGECLKGALDSPRLVVKQAVHPDIPQFEPEKSYLLFLEAETEKGFSATVGFHQGVLPLEKSNGEFVFSSEARRVLKSLSRSEPDLSMARPAVSTPASDYEAFKRTVRHLVKEAP